MKRLGIVLDVESGEITGTIPVRPEFMDSTIAGRPPCRPFGITWSHEKLFIVNNRQLLVYDGHLNYMGMSSTQLQINIHQLAYRSERVWAVSPWTNSLIGVPQTHDCDVVEFDLLSQTVRRYVQREASFANDKWHFNSLLWTDESLFVAAHAFGPFSFINRYDSRTLRLSRVHRNAGHSIHGLAHHEGELFWLSTKTGQIRSDSAYCCPLPRQGFARGFAMTSGHFIVGTSTASPRSERHAGDSWIHVIDRQERAAVSEVCLRNTGSINDLRLLDEYDYGHAIDPFWST
jgi:hypothetical protein